MLCQFCQDITLEALHSPLGYQHLPSFNALKASAKSGLCSLCHLFWSAVKDEVDKPQPTQDSMMEYPVRLCLNGMLKSFNDKFKKQIFSSAPTTESAFQLLDLNAAKTPSRIDICALESTTSTNSGWMSSWQGRVSLYRDPYMDRFSDSPYGGRPVSFHANSQECFELATRWIRTCLTEHDLCRRAVCPVEWAEEPEDPWNSELSCDASDSSDSCDEPSSKCIKLSRDDDIQVLQRPSNSTKHRTPQSNTTNMISSRGFLGRPVKIDRQAEGFPPGHIFGSSKLHVRRNSLEKLEEREGIAFQDRTIPLLPTRYIYVDSNPPRLCVAEPGSRGFYVALSHCWGKSKPLTTTTKTLLDRLRELPMADMPRTFYDAITITRELGLEYLWIDSLCILQDSAEDWQRESSKMGPLYSNAFLTISAAASTDSTQGIFKPRSISSNPPVRIKPHDSDSEFLYVAEFVDDVPFKTPQPIDSRAWCLQETALSPRVLVYGTRMLGWLCDSMTDSEQGGVSDHYKNPPGPLLAPRLQYPTLRDALDQDGPDFDLFPFLRAKDRQVGLWPSIVNDYTRRALSYETDRLPALSGIAKEMQFLIKDEYLAGLWKSELRYDLLWQVDVLFAQENETWKRPAKYRAPSWSWASIEGPVTLNLRSHRKILGEEYFGFPEEPEMFRLLEAEVDTAGIDPFGQVSGGHLKLLAGLKQVTLRERNWGEDSESNPTKPLWREERLQERNWRLSDVQGNDIGRCCLDMPSERMWDQITLWWVVIRKWEGILITNTEKKGEYVRVGIAWPNESSTEPDIPEEQHMEIILV